MHDSENRYQQDQIIHEGERMSVTNDHGWPFAVGLVVSLTIALFSAAILTEQRSAASPSAAAGLGPGRKYTTVERLTEARLRAVNEDRMGYQKSRQAVKLRTGLDDYRAIMHAHAEDSAHTGGTRPEILDAAKRAGVRIILLSDHVRPPKDFINESWRGMHDGVLFIPGAESEGFLIHPTQSMIKQYIDKSWKTRDEYINLVSQNGGNIFLSHVEERPDWETSRLDGLEIYNLHTDLKDESEFVTWLRGSLTNPQRLSMIQQLLDRYPAEFFGSLQDYLVPVIAKWDRDLNSHDLTGIAANDCHHNQVFTIKAASPDAIEISIIGDPPRKVTTQQSSQVAEMLKGRSPGDLIARLDLDPYERSMEFVSTHILLNQLSENDVRKALKTGRAYVAHDWLCDSTGFAMITELHGRRNGVMGDRVKLEKGLALRLEAPAAGLIKIFRNGELLRQARSNRVDAAIVEPGVYRAEIWMEIDGEERPWIYSNPIRIEQ